VVGKGQRRDSGSGRHGRANTATQAPIDPGAELGAARLVPYHWALVSLIVLATLFDGYGTLVPSYVIHFVVKPWHLAPSDAGFLVSAGLIGFAVGAVGHGPIADKFGRRPTLISRDGGGRARRGSFRPHPLTGDY
jgi:hypothetical protein